MPAETLLTAARRIVRFVRIDDRREGGLLSLDTIQAAEILDRQLEAENRFVRESEVTDISTADGKWYVRFNGSIEAVEYLEEPRLSVGDRVDIIIRRRT